MPSFRYLALTVMFITDPGSAAPAPDEVVSTTEPDPLTLSCRSDAVVERDVHQQRVVIGGPELVRRVQDDTAPGS